MTDIRLTYPDGDSSITALDDVDLHVPAGQLRAVVGPSGSGKSSLLAVAATLTRPDAGTVDVAGLDTGHLSATELTRLRLSKIGIVFQQPNLISSLTATEQLLVTDHMRRRSGTDRAAAEKLLATVGLADKRHRRPHQLSGGERQRVNIARALTGDPVVLLVDEPTAALDHDRGASIVELITAVTRRYQVATVMVTHDTEHLAGVDAVASMWDGSLAEETAAPRP